MEFHSSVVLTSKNVTSIDEIRRSTKYHPTIWGDYFLSYDSDKTEITEAEYEELAKQKDMVKKLLARVPDKSMYKIELIDAIQRLGVKYHFEREIEESLQYIHAQHNSKDNDLHTVALRFRLLRQQGYNVPCDVFSNFIDNEGKFVDSIKDNVEGLLNLFEAAHLGTHGEEILDKAIEFCSSHLRTSVQLLNNASLSKRVNEALKMPIRRTVPRFGARKFMSMYEEDESHNEILLNFAKLDFNMVQKMHQRELSDITRWWKKFDVANKMPYTRDRIVELFFWMEEVYFEPQYAVARSILIKITSMTSIVDDTYEHATLDQLQTLTDAIQRWDVDETLEDSPPNIQMCYKSLIQTFVEIEDEMEKAGKSYRLQYAKQEFKKLVMTYFEEAKWMYNDHIPTVEEYMKLSLISSTYMLLSTTSLIGMGSDQVRKEDFDWVVSEPLIVQVSEPLIVQASCVICRLMDDIVGDQYEQKTSAVQCYMKQYGVSRDEACDELRKQVNKAWKDMNRECLEPRPASMDILMRVVNLCRVICLLYIHDDCYSNSVEAKELIKMVLADPVEI